MQSFLHYVADDLYRKCGGRLDNVTVVFPNKRASLFFNQRLADVAGRPVWSPRYAAVGDLFRSMSALDVADPILLVCRLYDVYRRVTGTDEPLDKFYSWGMMMLADFEDIDNNLARADKLFENVTDLETLTGYDFLSERQRDALRRYFQNFDAGARTQLKQRFLALWNHLPRIYDEFRAALRADGLAYEGMLKRDVAERLAACPAGEGGRYAIVGFNVLNETERRLFLHLKGQGRAVFYWDYDEAYAEGANEAGRFVRENIRTFGNELAGCPGCFDNFARPKRVIFVSAPTESAQARYAGGWLRDHAADGAPLNETAVVLCNEHALQSVLHAVPSGLTLNVTMGFPLRQTPVASFVGALLDLQLAGTSGTAWRYGQVAAVLRHPYTARVAGEDARRVLCGIRASNNLFPQDELFGGNDFLRRVFARHADNASLLRYLADMVRAVGASYKGADAARGGFDEQLYVESVFSAFTAINRLIDIERTGLLRMRREGLARLLRQVVGERSVPFHGEPAVGVQVMGLLETRNLDFRNVVVLGANDENLPGAERRSSLIPYTLREAYGMTTVERQTSLYAYYFYRLLQRAENVALAYSNATEGLSRGEMSRFMMQLLTTGNPRLKTQVRLLTLTSGSEPAEPEPLEVAKSDQVVRELKERFHENILSPSAINSYIDCGLRFYFRYVAGLKVEDEVTDEVGNDVFGTIFHDCMERVYRGIGVGREIQAATLLGLAENRAFVGELVDEGFRRHFFRIPDGAARRPLRYNGEQELNRRVLMAYVENQLKYDATLCPMSVVGLEDKRYTMRVRVGDTDVLLGGTIDRMDLVSVVGDDGVPVRQLRVVDYKTSSAAKSAESVEQLFDGSKASRATHVLQALYYSHIVCQDTNLAALGAQLDGFHLLDATRKGERGIAVAPALMYIKLAGGRQGDDGASVVRIGSRGGKSAITDYAAQCQDVFGERLMRCIAEIFSPDVPFRQAAGDAPCKYCDFVELCGRHPKKDN